MSFFWEKRQRESASTWEINAGFEKTLAGSEYFDLNSAAPGAILPKKNHQCGLAGEEDESDGKTFSFAPTRCPVEKNKNYLHHLNPELSCLFQRPESLSISNFNPGKQQIWYVNCPVGGSTLGNFLKTMSINEGIIPHLTNHCICATLVTVLSEANYVRKHIRSITGHKSDTSVDSYSGSASFRKREEMANGLASFLEIDKGNTSANIQAQVQVIPKLITVLWICFFVSAKWCIFNLHAHNFKCGHTIPWFEYTSSAKFENNFNLNNISMAQVMTPPPPPTHTHTLLIVLWTLQITSTPVYHITWIQLNC